MKFLLDTNVCVDYLTGRYPRVVERIQRSDPEDLVLSSVVVAELRYGAEKSRKRRHNHQRLDSFVAEFSVMDLDFEAASSFGRVRAELERKGMVIGPYDMLIAAHALSAGLILVTDNEAELRRVRGLRVENWRGA